MLNSPKVLVVEDDVNMREMIVETLKSHDLNAAAVMDINDTLWMIKEQEYALVITDLQLPPISGITVLKEVKKQWARTNVILITAYATVDSAVEALRMGAFDYIQKPFEPHRLAHTSLQAVRYYQMSMENEWLRKEADRMWKYEEMVGRSKGMRAVYEIIDKTADYDNTVLIEGESGTGKELVAKAIHNRSERKDGPFFVLNCGAIPESLMESELFGHEKGAFTGADQNKQGLLEMANSGTLLLDEINNAPMSLQAKLLRTLQDGSFIKVGGTKTCNTSARFLTTTNCDLEKMIEEKGFRQDLYYRLRGITISIPPLRDRRDDIPMLAQFFLEKSVSVMKKNVKRFSAEIAKVMLEYKWPGNVRELENTIESMVIMADGEMLTIDHLPKAISGGSDRNDSPQLVPQDMTLLDMEAYMIKRALMRTNGNKIKAAKLLGIDQSTLWRKLKKIQTKD
ncbi:MAG: acetoacetate metabolism regulatory protein AtoC [bacterium]|nr:MAG: acetoacetate metabolism regulatory protein AtoC [bacterium]